MRWFALALIAPLLPAVVAEDAIPWMQRRGGAPARRAAPAVPLTKVAPAVKCPSPLGVGVGTKRLFCDVLTGGNPAEGIVIDLPPRVGPLTLTFDLHNRQLYSEELVRTNRAYARYTASIGAMYMDVTLISRAVIQSEFRTANDLFDRISGGAGPAGVKAVAPLGQEAITITITEPATQVSLLGEKLTVDRLEGPATYSTPGRPIAIISNVMIEYRPAPAAPAPATRKPAR